MVEPYRSRELGSFMVWLAQKSNIDIVIFTLHSIIGKKIVDSTFMTPEQYTILSSPHPHSPFRPS
jgi:hypothetical protein